MQSRFTQRAPGVALAVLALTGGCALPTSPGDAAGGPSVDGSAAAPAAVRAPAREGAADRVAPVVADMLGALVQLREPRLTTIQLGPYADDPVLDALVAALVDAGYGIQRVAADQGANLLGWRYGPVDPAAAPASRPAASGTAAVAAAREASGVVDPGRLRARLEIGALSLERDYRPGARKGSLVAASPLEVGGTRTLVTLDDAVRLPGTPAAHSRVHVGAAAPSFGAAPIISLVTDDVVRGVTARATRSRRAPATSRRAVNSNRVEVSNLFFGASAFDTLRAEMAPVATGTVLFGNDSMRLGADGKRQIARFIEDYRPGTDMIGLVGCSNGPTRLAIGNEGLALGRSARVTDELVALGVERSRILDEGCWAGQSAKGRFPSRGVVIELLRPAS